MEEKKSTSVYAIIAGVLFAVIALLHLNEELWWMFSEVNHFYTDNGSIYERLCGGAACAAFAVLLLLKKEADTWSRLLRCWYWRG